MIAQGIRKTCRISSTIKIEELTKVGGLKIVEDWLEKELGEEEFYKCMRVWGEFEACKRKPDEKVEE